MMLGDLITSDAILPAVRVSSKKALLQQMGERAALISGLPASDILAALMQRERLGSTGVGNGIAIPHGKLATCDRIYGVFASLDKPIPFDAMDGSPVDLVFMLIASENAGADHLKALAKVARFLRDPRVALQLRTSRDAEAQFSVFRQTGQASHAA